MPTIDSVSQFLDDFSTAKPWLEELGFSNPQGAHENIVLIAKLNIPFDLLAELLDQLQRYLPGSADPDRALNNLERMLQKVRSPLSLLTFLSRKPTSMATLMQVFSVSQYFSELLIANPEYFDYLWEYGRQTLHRGELVDEIQSELRWIADDDELVLNLVRRYRQREILRIGYRDIVLGDSLEDITRSISDLADCLVEVALQTALKKHMAKLGQPILENGGVARVTVLALGKLGGEELNYSSDIDLIVLFEGPGWTNGNRKLSNDEFFTRVVQDAVRYLSVSTARGYAYRVDLRLRPHGDLSPLCCSIETAKSYYDLEGRTWERQAMVKARPIAGSLELGRQFLRDLESFVYRRFLTFVEINEIKAIKHKIEAICTGEGGEETDLKTGRGGIRDIEFVVQFLQLLHGGAFPMVRDTNTLRGLQKLAHQGCINPDEHDALESAYRFLRKGEHRLQFMFDLQLHRIPEDRDELDKLARRLGYSTLQGTSTSEQFLRELRTTTDRNRTILGKLMMDLFPTDASPGASEPETDLILDPDPAPERVKEVLSPRGFSDFHAAKTNLARMSQEDVPFLSSLRCRHFLSHIAPRLLRAIGETPNPDRTLATFEKVTSSLGAKGVLWESFSHEPKFLSLCVNLCSWSRMLAEILVVNPGMIDELLDSLNMNRPPTLNERQHELDRLLKGAQDPEPILVGYKSTHLLNIGVSDILGKSSIHETVRGLSNLAETVLNAVVDLQFHRLTKQFGRPRRSDDSTADCQFCFLAMGKFGGREMGYHSDLDLVLVYESEGRTKNDGSESATEVSNLEFFTELARRLQRALDRTATQSRLYEVDYRLRPTGHSGSLAVGIEQFEQYYSSADAGLWEQMALTRARAVAGSKSFCERMNRMLPRLILVKPWSAEKIDEILDMRKRLAASRASDDFKRGEGGIVDVEFAVQMLQLRFGAERPAILVTNIPDALARIRGQNLVGSQLLDVLASGYDYLRTIENRIGAIANVSRETLPEDEADLEILARRMLNSSADDVCQKLSQQVSNRRQSIRESFLKVADLCR